MDGFHGLLAFGEVNDVLYVVPQGTKPIPLTTKVTVQPYSYKTELAKAALKPLPEEARAYLGPCEGIDPKTSALNRYLQSWDVPNLFVMGATAFPQNAGYNPTATVAALAHWSAKAIKEQYLKNPGPLVQA